MPLDLSFHALDGHVVVVQVRGQLDRPAAARLSDRLFSIPVPPAPRIILDLSSLDFADASGPRVLLACQLRARLRGGTIALACARPMVLRELRVTGLDRDFAVCSTVAQAVRAARDAPQALARSAGPDDIVHLIIADRARIHLRWEELRAAARGGPRAKATRALARGWAEVAQSVDAHLAAMREICLLAMLGTGPQAAEQMGAVLSEHEDIRELLSEARLQPPGSPSWWRLVSDSMSRWAQLTEREASGVLTGFALSADEALRHRLGRQWRAFLAAWHQDRGPSSPEDRMAGELENSRKHGAVRIP
jgi:anti-sigma B factor antagonist